MSGCVRFLCPQAPPDVARQLFQSCLTDCLVWMSAADRPPFPLRPPHSAILVGAHPSVPSRWTRMSCWRPLAPHAAAARVSANSHRPPGPAQAAPRGSGAALAGEDQQQYAADHQRNAGEFERIRLFAKEEMRGDEGEDQLDLAERAHIGGVLDRHGREPSH